jgi:hypothetical protein
MRVRKKERKKERVSEKKRECVVCYTLNRLREETPELRKLCCEKHTMSPTRSLLEAAPEYISYTFVHSGREGQRRREGGFIVPYGNVANVHVYRHAITLVHREERNAVGYFPAYSRAFYKK